MIYEQIQKLCRKENIKISNMLKEIGISPSTTSNWKSTDEMRSGTLIKIADYFGVSTDYILGRTTETPKNESNNNQCENFNNINNNKETIKPLEPLEQEWLNLFQKHPKEEQLDLIKMVYKTEKKEEEKNKEVM